MKLLWILYLINICIIPSVYAGELSIFDDDEICIAYVNDSLDSSSRSTELSFSTHALKSMPLEKELIEAYASGKIERDFFVNQIRLLHDRQSLEEKPRWRLTIVREIVETKAQFNWLSDDRHKWCEEAQMIMNEAVPLENKTLELKAKSDRNARLELLRAP